MKLKGFFEFLIGVAMMPLLAGASPFMHVLFAVILVLAIVLPKPKNTFFLKYGLRTTACGTVTINIAQASIGQSLQTNDGICGMVLTGVTEEGGYTLGTPIYVTSLASASSGANAITLANNPFAYRQISDFYSVPGTVNAGLYIMLVPNTMTVADMADNTNSASAKVLLNYAKTAGLPIKKLYIMSDDTVVTVADITAGINPACYTAVTNMQVMATAFAALQLPFRCIIGATSYDGTVGNLTNMTSGTTNNRVELLLWDLQPSSGYSGGAACALGFTAGCDAVLPVQRKRSRVKNGPLPGISECYVGTETVEAAGGDIATMVTKGFATVQTYPQASGYFFSGVPMCTATSDTYNTLVAGCVIDKAQIIAYARYLQEVDDEVPVQADGTIDPSWAGNLQQETNNDFQTNMVAPGNCTSASCSISLTQNIAESGLLAIMIVVNGVAYAVNIQITLGLAA